MVHLSLVLITAVLATLSAAAKSFAGVNHYFLAALNSTERRSIISTLHAANTRVIRTFVRPEDAFEIEKGNRKDRFPDVESPLGNFANFTTILNRYDDMLYDVYSISSGRMKVLLGLHDANMIAGHNDPCDAYCLYMQSRNINWGQFYSDSFFRQAYKTRLQNILVTYKSKNFKGRTWSQLSEVLFGIDLQNEPGVGGKQNYVIGTGWICDISTFLRQLLAPGIAVATGAIGGALSESNNNFPDELLSCSAVDIVSLHGYFSRSGSVSTSAGQPWCNWLSPSSAGSLLTKAKSAGKLVMAEEWAYQKGATGIRKEDIAAQGHALNALGIPWTYWDVMTGNEEECGNWCQDPEVSVSPGGSPSGAWDALKNALGEAGKVSLADGQDWSRFIGIDAGGASITDGTCGKGSGGGGGGACTWGCLGWSCNASSPCSGELECVSSVCKPCTWGCQGWSCSKSRPCKSVNQCESGVCKPCNWGCPGWQCSSSSPCQGSLKCTDGTCR